MTTDKKEVEKAVGTICRVAKIIIVVNGDYEESAVPLLKETAIALKEYYQLDDEIVARYDEEIEKAKALDTTPGISFIDVDDAQDIIFEMCQSITDPKEIMKHVFNARELRYVCDSKLRQRNSIW